ATAQGTGPCGASTRNSKKNFGDRFGSVEARCPMISELSKEEPVAELSALLGVARSGYYAWLKGRPHPRAQSNERLWEEIREVFKEHRGNYGSPRITRQLRGQGRA